jgi:hypothetical protein
MLQVARPPAIRETPTGPGTTMGLMIHGNGKGQGISDTTIRDTVGSDRVLKAAIWVAMLAATGRESLQQHRCLASALARYEGASG